MRLDEVVLTSAGHATACSKQALLGELTLILWLGIDRYGPYKGMALISFHFFTPMPDRRCPLGYAAEGCWNTITITTAFNTILFPMVWAVG